MKFQPENPDSQEFPWKSSQESPVREDLPTNEIPDEIDNLIARSLLKARDGLLQENLGSTEFDSIVSPLDSFFVEVPEDQLLAISRRLQTYMGEFKRYQKRLNFSINKSGLPSFDQEGDKMFKQTEVVCNFIYKRVFQNNVTQAIAFDKCLLLLNEIYSNLESVLAESDKDSNALNRKGLLYFLNKYISYSDPELMDRYFNTVDKYYFFRFLNYVDLLNELLGEIEEDGFGVFLHVFHIKNNQLQYSFDEVKKRLANLKTALNAYADKIDF